MLQPASRSRQSLAKKNRTQSEHHPLTVALAQHSVATALHDQQSCHTRETEMRKCVVLALAVLAACARPVPEAPAPEQYVVQHSPAEVVRMAASALAAVGYEATTSDADAGVLVMRRVRQGAAATEGHACRWPSGSVAERNLRTAHTVTISARAREGGGSTVVVSSHTVSDYPRQQGLHLPLSETDCVSDGSAESRVIAALRAG